jgi:Raf kinase inhibitor-like YbhB/YbcL family protein
MKTGTLALTLSCSFSTLTLLLAVASLAVASGCNGGGSGNGIVAAAPAGMSIQRLAVTSRSFSSNGAIPVDYTCDGADKSPQLTWSAAPSGTKSFAILVVDPDAIGGEFIHWVAFNLHADATSLPESSDTTDLGGVPGTNGFGRTGYSGPCPPKFELHSYAFRVYALDTTLAARSGVTADDLNEAMNGHVLAQGTLVGTFSH